ncbi:MAG: hypothetical protein AAF465_09895 [Pseudomonadota bacterium]
MFPSWIGFFLASLVAFGSSDFAAAANLTAHEQQKYVEILEAQASLDALIAGYTDDRFRKKQRQAKKELRLIRRLLRKTKNTDLTNRLHMRLNALLREIGSGDNYDERVWRDKALTDTDFPVHHEFTRLYKQLYSTPNSRYDTASRLYSLPTLDAASGNRVAQPAPHSSAPSNSQTQVAESTSPPAVHTATVQFEEVKPPIYDPDHYRGIFDFRRVFLPGGDGTYSPLSRCDDGVSVFYSVVNSRNKYDGSTEIWNIRHTWSRMAKTIADQERQSCPGLNKIVFVARESKVDQPLFRLEFNRNEGFKLIDTGNVMVSGRGINNTISYLQTIHEQYTGSGSTTANVEASSVLPPVPALDIFIGHRKFFADGNPAIKAMNSEEQLAAWRALREKIDRFNRDGQRADYAHRRATGRGLSYLPLPQSETLFVQSAFYPSVNAILYYYAQLISQLPYSVENVVDLMGYNTPNDQSSVISDTSKAVDDLLRVNNHWARILGRCQYEKFAVSNLCVDPYRNFARGRTSDLVRDLKFFLSEYLAQHEQAIIDDLTAGRLDASVFEPIRYQTRAQYVAYTKLARVLAPDAHEKRLDQTVLLAGSTIGKETIVAASLGEVDSVKAVFDAVSRSSAIDEPTLLATVRYWRDAAAFLQHDHAQLGLSNYYKTLFHSFDYAMQSARSGNVDAMKIVAQGYDNGNHVPQSPADARYWYFHTAHAGDCSVHAPLSSLLVGLDEAAQRQQELDTICASYLQAQAQARQQRLSEMEERRRLRIERDKQIRRETARRQAQIVSDSRAGKTGDIKERYEDLRRVVQTETQRCFQAAQDRHFSKTLNCLVPHIVSDQCVRMVRNINSRVAECTLSANERIHEASLYVLHNPESCPTFRAQLQSILSAWGVAMIEIGGYSSDKESWMGREREHFEFGFELTKAFALVRPSSCP